MSVAVITGSAGLIGSEAAAYFGGLGLDVVGIDNNLREVFFGREGSTAWNARRLQAALGGGYRHHDLDVRDAPALDALFATLGTAVVLVIHTAAQPSHDWAAREPLTDFGINAAGTLNVLEATRRHCPEAVFLFTSTNKVYGDTPNSLPLVELERRWDIDRDHTYASGIREDMSIDTSLHSVFGASKVGGGPNGARVRSVLRDAHCMLPRWHAHRAKPLGCQTARFPRIRDEVHYDRDAVQRVWI